VPKYQKRLHSKKFACLVVVCRLVLVPFSTRARSNQVLRSPSLDWALSYVRFIHCLFEYILTHYIFLQGLAVIQGAKMAGVGKIIAVDINPQR